MSLIFYYAPMSTASLTSGVLEELGVNYERVKLDLQKGDTKKPEFLKLNPNAKVPVLVHDGSAIWESAAITMYLGELFGVEKGLYPAPGPKRGEVMKWIIWTNVTLGDAVSRYTRNAQNWYPADLQNPKAAEVAKKDIGDLLQILNQALESKQFLAGNYSLADTHLHLFSEWLRHLQIDFSAFDHVNAWSKRCAARPAYARTMASETP